MFAVPFGRIFWKEYRVHRGLWLSCGLIGCLLQLVFWWTLVRSPYPEIGPSEVLATIIPLMYAVGCGALLFAGEREERTSDWLLALAAPPAPTLVAKFAFAIGSTLVLQLLMEILTTILLPSNINHRVVDRLSIGSITLVWAILGSVRSRRVMTSFLSMFFYAFVTVILGLFLVITLANCLGLVRSGNGEVETAILRIGLFAILVMTIGLDFWLGWRWCEGQYYEGAIFEDARSRLSGWWRRVTHRPITISRVPIRVEYDQSWQRTWQRLVWQERHRESLHRLIFIAGAVLGAALSIGGMVLQSPQDRNGLTLLFFGLMIPIPLVMGLLGFQSDANLNQPRFLASRGVPAASVWLAKHAVWLWRAFWIPTVLIAVAWLFNWILNPPNVAQTGRSPFQNFYSVLCLQPFSVIWLVILSYGSGQLAGLLFQRTVLAIVFGLLFNAIAFFWFAVMEFLGVPQWWSLGLPVIAMFSITLWQMSPRMLESHSWSRLGKLAAALVAIHLVLIALLACFRISEANMPLAIDQSLLQRFRSPRPTPQTPTPDEESKRLRLLTLSRLDDVDHEAVVNEIAEILRDNDVSLAPKYPFEDEVFTNSARLRQILAKQAETYLEAGLLDKSLDCHLACLRLSRSVSRGSFFAWEFGSNSQGSTLETLVTWANHPLQTPETIRAAITSVEAELAKFPSATEGIIDSFHNDRRTWILSSREDVIAELTRMQAFENGSLALLSVFLLPWERQRADLLISKDAQIRFAAVWSLEKRLESPRSAAYQTVTQDYSAMSAANMALTTTTPIAKLVNYPLSFAISKVLNYHTNLRAAITRMELTVYRQEHGNLPERLVQLMETVNGNYLVDPWSSRLFEYYPSFLLSSGNLHASLVPASPTEVEIVRDSTRYRDERINFRDITNEVSHVESLDQERAISLYLFKIPPKWVRQE